MKVHKSSCRDAIIFKLFIVPISSAIFKLCIMSEKNAVLYAPYLTDLYRNVSNIDTPY